MCCGDSSPPRDGGQKAVLWLPKFSWRVIISSTFIPSFPANDRSGLLASFYYCYIKAHNHLVGLDIKIIFQMGQYTIKSGPFGCS